MNLKRETNQNARGSHRFSHLGSVRLVSFVKKGIKKHQAFGFGRKKYGAETKEKDWEMRPVRERIRYLLKRNVFDSRLDSRESLARFFEDLNENIINGSNKSESQEKVNSLMERYFDHLVRKNRPKDVRAFLEIFRTNMELIIERSESLIDHIRGIKYPKKQSKNNKEEQNKYFLSNSKDAYGQLSPPYLNISIMRSHIQAGIEHLQKVRR